ncbi:serine protease [Sphingomonas oleivorans]|uniref:Serine protease n=1 Tax=Sphingomonas oleivorans TaxID=1735121 RepID=A0A2T5FZ95_9SPHN|nr:S1C family serine protease [Sphingomonas oleivorans]PTQ12022.1 serine protease [Sphingomonas oleivorans]
MASPSSPFADLSSALADMVARASPHVVEVQSHRSLASGFFWREGLVVTPDETLAEEGKIEIELADGKVLEAKLVGRDPATDIALLRVEGANADAVAFGSDDVRPGALALIVAAAESAPLVAFGAIAAVGPAWQSMRGGTIDTRIEMDVRLRRRAEGGLAIDGSGQVFGMAVRGPRGRTLVIPAATIDRVAGQLAEYGRVPVAYLGAGLKDVPLDAGGSGVMVMTLDRAGPAAAGGLQQGDIILSWAGKRMPHVGALLHMLRATPVGSQVTLGLRRGGSPIELGITIGDRPAK